MWGLGSALRDPAIVACDLRNVQCGAVPCAVEWVCRDMLLGSRHAIAGVRTWSADKLLWFGSMQPTTRTAACDAGCVIRRGGGEDAGAGILFLWMPACAG